MRLLLATLAILFGSQADSQQLSTTLPFEAIVNLGSQTGNGADRSWPITFNGTINAIDGNVSLGFPMGYVPATTANTPAPHMTPAAFGEALVNCWHRDRRPIPLIRRRSTPGLRWLALATSARRAIT